MVAARARQAAGGAAAGRDVRLHHRLARAERSPAARVAARRPEGRGSAPGARHDEEPGRAGVSLHRHAPRRSWTALWAEHEALQKAGTICPFVFHRNGRRIKSFRGAWANACTAAGYPGLIPHDLRRSAVRNMERAGLSRSVAMQLTGHKTEAVYRRYAITSEADLREGVERLNDATGTNRGDNRPNASGRCQDAIRVNR